ncbi:MAG: TetR/AcrR family transcriptional regulator [Leeuwenhoekiella sp.]
MEDKILHKAAEMFLSQGFKSVTMDDIAQEMGISKKTIYTHFETKLKLVEMVTYFLFDVIHKGITEIQSRNLNVIEELFVIKDFAMQNLKDEKSSPVFQLQKYYPKIYKKVHGQQIKLMTACVTDNLERGIATGFYRPKIKVCFVSKIYYMCTMGIKNPEIFPPHDFIIKDVTSDYLDYHLRAIATPQGLEILQQFTNEKEG